MESAKSHKITATVVTEIYEQVLYKPQLYKFGAGRALLFSAKCPGSDRENQDAAAVVSIGDNACVLILADGTGGQPRGADAARVAVKSVIKSVTEAVNNGGELREGILNGFELANHEVIAFGVGAGTTLCVVEVQDSVASPYHVGDSSITVAGERGKIKYDSIPHSPVGYAVEAGMMNQKEAIHDQERNIVSNILGYADMRIEVGPHIPLALRDTLLICSDGLTDNFLPEEIVERVRTGKLKASMENLAAEVHQRMTAPLANQPSAPDDCTVILFRQ